MVSLHWAAKQNSTAQLQRSNRAGHFSRTDQQSLPADAHVILDHLIIWHSREVFICYRILLAFLFLELSWSSHASFNNQQQTQLYHFWLTE